jgi:hypothetical protein
MKKNLPTAVQSTSDLWIIVVPRKIIGIRVSAQLGVEKLPSVTYFSTPNFDGFCSTVFND